MPKYHCDMRDVEEEKGGGQRGEREEEGWHEAEWTYSPMSCTEQTSCCCMVCSRRSQETGSMVCRCRSLPAPWCCQRRREEERGREREREGEREGGREREGEREGGGERGREREGGREREEGGREHTRWEGMNDTHKYLYLFRTLAMPKSPNLTTPALVRKIF